MYLTKTPRSVWRIFLAGFQAYGQSFLSALPFLIIMLVFSGLPCLLMALEKEPNFSAPFHRLFVILFYITCFLLPFIMMWVFASVILRVNGWLTNMPLSSREAGQMAWKKFSIYLISVIVLMVIIAFGFALLIIPGIVLMVYLCFPMFCILIDNKDVVGSLKYSASLVKNHWWRTCLFILLVLLVNTLIAGVLNIPIWLLFSPREQNSFCLTLFLNAVANFFILPWYISVFSIMYHDLKWRKKEIQ